MAGKPVGARNEPEQVALSGIKHFDAGLASPEGKVAQQRPGAKGVQHFWYPGCAIADVVNITNFITDPNEEAGIDSAAICAKAGAAKIVHEAGCQVNVRGAPVKGHDGLRHPRHGLADEAKPVGALTRPNQGAF